MIGRIISHYQILERLGEGGMGVVYKARDLRLNRPVALKFLRQGDEASWERILRFRLEAQAISALNHPHIATIFDIEETEGERFLVLEYMPGGTLREKILPKKRVEEFLPLEGVMDYACQIGEGLAHAHQQGIIHRDIKSDNVMLTHDGSLKITDFGLAKLEGVPGITRTGVMHGTIPYIPPESFRGEPADHRYDIYSFGVVLFELLTGCLPYQAGDSPAWIYAILHHEPIPISSIRSGVPQLLIDIVAKALQKDPDRRYQNLSEMLDDLRSVASSCGPPPENLSTVLMPHGKPPLRKSWLQSTRDKLKRMPLGQRFGIGAGVFLVLLLSGWVTMSLNMIRWLESFWNRPAILVAVYPFENKSGSPENSLSCDGLTSTLRLKLMELQKVYPRLVVIPDIYLKDIAPRDANQLAGADFLLNGEVHRFAPDIQVAFHLINAKTRREVYSERVVASSVGEVNLQATLLRRILESMDFKFNRESSTVVAAGETRSSSAYKFYLRAMGYLHNKDLSGNLNRAITLFDLALEIDSRFPLALVGKGEAQFYKYYMEGRSDPGLIRQARKFCEQALQADPSLVRGHIVLGMIHMATGRYELAEIELEQALRLDPRNGEAHRNLADLFQSTSRDKEAEAAFRKAVELSPQAWFGYRDYGYFLFRKGRYQEAQEQYDQVFKMVPDNLQALCDSASMRLFLGEVETAAEIYERLVKISPYPIYLSNLAQASLYLGRYDRAIQLAEKAAELWPNDAEIVGTLGDIYRGSPGHLAKAAPIYEKAILLTEKRLLINPNEVEELADLAAYLAKTGRKERAMVEIRKAVQLNPSDVRIRGLEAVVYEACGMRNEALNALKEATSLGFTLPEIKFEPEFRQLVKDPRFGEIEELMKGKTPKRR